MTTRPPRTSHCFTRGVSPLPCTSGSVWEGGWGIWVGLGLRIKGVSKEGN
uniref:Uncharacterized protein n=1 Tax=Human herpesvirus 2 TaxID=10310 RepID=A0A481T4Y7_HHV2|nr:hypothetical protein [Human alphaherpesvirus 2]